jgi:uncharacterized membrane protein YccC
MGELYGKGEATPFFSIIVLVRIDGGPTQAAIARFLEVGLGIIVALAVTLLVFPPRPAKLQLTAAT